jgi:hypothetical protein
MGGHKLPDDASNLFNLVMQIHDPTRSAPNPTM